MSVRIRLKRLGRKKRPVYRVVVANQKSPRDGKVVEEIGFYDPFQEPRALRLKEERVKYWLSVGAQASESVQRLLSEEGIVPTKARTDSYRTAKDLGIAKADRGKEPEAPAEEAKAPAEEAPTEAPVAEAEPEAPAAEEAPAEVEPAAEAEEAPAEPETAEETPAEAPATEAEPEAPVEDAPAEEASTEEPAAEEEQA